MTNAKGTNDERNDKFVRQMSSRSGTVPLVKIVGDGVPAGRRSDDFMFRIIRFNGKRDGAALDDLLVKEFQSRARFKSDPCQNGFGLAF